MASPATENPIAPSSVAIDIPAPTPAPTTDGAAVETVAATTPAPSTTTPTVPAATTPQSKPATGKSKAGPSKNSHRQSGHRENYKIVCCGNSCLDLLLVPLSAIVLYGAMIGLSVLVLWSVFLTSTSGAAHWVFFFAWITGVIAVVMSVQVAEYETYLKAEHVKKQVAEGTNA